MIILSINILIAEKLYYNLDLENCIKFKKKLPIKYLAVYKRRISFEKQDTPYYHTYQQ